MSDVVLATVLFTDIVGSTERAVELGDERWRRLLERHQRAVRAELARFGGVEIDTAGDGFLASFSAPGQAVRCAVAIVGRSVGIGVPVRAGVHTGECERIGEKLAGVTVHIGARICGEAGPSEVLVSGTVRELVAGSALPFSDRGLRALKGIPGEWHLYSLQAELAELELPASGPPEVVGREDELELVRAFAGGEGFGALVLEGEAGIGKTTLWREAVGAASQDGARVLVARPAAPETGLAFTGLADLLAEDLDEAVAELPEPQRAALEVALARRKAEGGAADPRTVAAAVLGGLRALALSGPLVVAVDDVQWLDAGSAAALAYACRRLGGEPVRLAASLRLAPGLSPGPLVEALPADRVTRVEVRPLSSGALHRVIRVHLDRTLPRPVLQRVHELSGGNPFYALELARSLPEDPPATFALPASLEGVTRERLDRLPAPVRRVLESAALLADPTPELLETLSEQPDRVGERLDTAVAAGVIEITGDSVRFSHPLLAEGMAAMIGPRRRAQLHTRLAELVDEPEQRAHHLALATTQPDAGIAAQIETGARAALARGAPSTAADLFQTAAICTPDDDPRERWRRTIDAARACEAAGLYGQGRRLLEGSLQELPPGTVRADALVVLADLRDDDFEAANRALEEALAEAQGDDARLSVIHRLRASLAFNVTGSVAAHREHAERSLAAATQTGDPALLVAALAEVSFAELAGGSFDRGRIDQALELWRRAPVRLRYSESPRWVRGMHCLLVDRLDEARTLLEAEAGEAAECGDDPTHSGILLHLVELECRAGNFGTAAAYADDYRVRELQHGEEYQYGGSLYAKALVDAHLGEVEGARASATEGIDVSTEVGSHVFRAQNLAVLGFLELSVGDVARADELLRPLPLWLVEHGWNEPSVCPAWPNAIEALVGVGEPQLAAEYLELYETRARRCDCPWALATAARCLGLLQLAQGEVDDALEAFEQALVEHRRTPGPFERGRTLMQYGIALRRARRRREARERLQEALAIFEELGARVFAERAREELARIGGRAPSDGALTPAETQIAALVAQGKSNKQVASELYLTERTVEGNLTRIYAKLGLRSRGELAAHFNRPRE
jgi:class 3 adenylate cyclase/DNA-binding CsgD family transcriptional regulator